MPTIISYRGYTVVYNIYGRREYTVQIDGDDCFFKTKKEAMKFIDELCKGEKV